jgi:hypothetical protein
MSCAVYQYACYIPDFAKARRGHEDFATPITVKQYTGHISPRFLYGMEHNSKLGCILQPLNRPFRVSFFHQWVGLLVAYQNFMTTSGLEAGKMANRFLT